jgi:hypothetical protein
MSDLNTTICDTTAVQTSSAESQIYSWPCSHCGRACKQCSLPVPLLTVALRDEDNVDSQTRQNNCFMGLFETAVHDMYLIMLLFYIHTHICLLFSYLTELCGTR